MSFLASIFPSGSALGPIIWLMQLGLIVHALRTGRPYWWILILIMVPGLGGLAYVLVEVLPGIQSPRGFFEALKPRKWRIAELRQRLEESETVVNRMNLAEALFSAGEFQEAHDVGVASLTGIFRNDPRTLTEVARYKLALGNYTEAYEILAKVDLTGNKMLGLELKLLLGDALSGLGRFAEAEEAYRSLDGVYIGEAPRAGLASLLERTSRKEEAAQMWREIVAHYRRAGPAWRRSERRWYKLAKTRLKSLVVALDTPRRGKDPAWCVDLLTLGRRDSSCDARRTTHDGSVPPCISSHEIHQ